MQENQGQIDERMTYLARARAENPCGDVQGFRDGVLPWQIPPLKLSRPRENEFVEKCRENRTISKEYFEREGQKERNEKLRERDRLIKIGQTDVQRKNKI